MRRRATIVVFALLAWVSGSALGGLQPSIPALAKAGIVVGAAHAGYTPSLSGSKPVVLLVVGSGARPGEDVEHSLADSLHLIFLNPATHHAVMVGIPRDSYVSIPSHGTSKINAALFLGGPSLLVQAIESMSGVQIDYWAITTFWGFTDMINAIGGLTVNVPFPMNDAFSRADFQPGVQELSGQEALAFARDRHDLTEGDFARSENGGRLLLASLAQFQKEYRTDPSRVFGWVGAGLTNIETTLSLPEIVQLAFTVTKVPLKNVQNVVLPGRAALAGSLSVVYLDGGSKSRIFADAKSDGMLSKPNVPLSPTANET